MNQNETAVPSRADSDMAFGDLFKQIDRAHAILNATLSLDSLEHMRDGDHAQICTLLEVCREHLEATEEARERCETAYGSLSRRIFNNPKASDALALDLLVELLSCAAVAKDSDQWRQQAALLGNSLVQYARYDASLMVLVNTWRGLIADNGGRTEILRHHDGSLELVYYSVRSSEVMGEAKP